MSNPGEELNLPFRPRARLLQLLGDQLIGTSRLAVFELVKNAYDADATEVVVTIDKIGTPSTLITVRDDGDGMTLETIRDIWLVPAHDHRDLQRRARRRTRLNRLPLGEKGVGRFAVHKLGEQIELVTRAKDSAECVVTIDWTALIRKPFLSDAEVSVRTREPEVFKDSTGTRITISNLRENNWSRGDIRRLLRQITSISSPFGTKSDHFKAILKVPEHPDWIESVPDVEGLLGRAPWHFRFLFKNGLLEWKYEFRGVSGIKLEKREESKKEQPLLVVQDRDYDEFGSAQGVKTGRPKSIVAGSKLADGIGPVTGEFFVYDREKVVLNKLGDSQLLGNFLDENGGVRVYRDGIRVYNYGEPSDDWLGLDLRRVNTPTRNISRNIVVGAIDLSLEASEALQEKTNREGFVDNDAFRRLKKIVLGGLAVLEVERKIDKDNIRKLTDTGRDPEVEKISKPLEKLRDAVRQHHLSAELDPLIDKVERDYEEMRDAMLRAGLSGMGLSVVFHEVEQGVRVLHDAIASGTKLETIQTQAKELVRILDGFTELLRKGDRRENSLKALIRQVRDINQVRFRSHKVRLVCPALDENFPDVKLTFAFGLALGALNNLLDNAFYWLRVRWPDDSANTGERRTIYININTDMAEGPAVVVADNGPGFQDDPQRLIRPFFSRRPDGMGIGLYYTNMVMELNRGRLAFPDAAEADVPEGIDGAVLALVFGAAEKV